jgi:hypothetical protein
MYIQWLDKTEDYNKNNPDVRLLVAPCSSES